MHICSVIVGALSMRMQFVSYHLTYILSLMCSWTILASMARKYHHNNTLQTNPRNHEEVATINNCKNANYLEPSKAKG